MIIKINKEDLMSLDMSYASKLAFKGKENFSKDPGVEAYRLYAYLGKQINNKVILDIGTRFGNSALALSKNGRNKVISYNIIEEGASVIEKKNITWILKDFRDDNTIEWNKVALILLDVDPHDGSKEREMLDYLSEIDWSGKIVFDDINLNNGMKKFWNSLPDEKKQDLSEVGHVSGTGIMEFNKK
jgi:hypothetical protein